MRLELNLPLSTAPMQSTDYLRLTVQMEISSDQHFDLGSTLPTVILPGSFADARSGYEGGPFGNPNSDHESSVTLDDDEAYGNAGATYGSPEDGSNSNRPSVRVVESQGVE